MNEEMKWNEMKCGFNEMGILRHFLSEHKTVEIYQKNSNSAKSCVADFFGSSKSRRRRRHTVRAASSRRRSQQILQDTDTLTLSPPISDSSLSHVRLPSPEIDMAPLDLGNIIETCIMLSNPRCIF